MMVQTQIFATESKGGASGGVSRRKVSRRRGRRPSQGRRRARGGVRAVSSSRTCGDDDRLAAGGRGWQHSGNFALASVRLTARRASTLIQMLSTCAQAQRSSPAYRPRSRRTVAVRADSRDGERQLLAAARLLAAVSPLLLAGQAQAADRRHVRESRVRNELAQRGVPCEAPVRFSEGKLTVDTAAVVQGVSGALADGSTVLRVASSSVQQAVAAARSRLGLGRPPARLRTTAPVLGPAGKHAQTVVLVGRLATSICQRGRTCAPEIPVKPTIHAWIKSSSAVPCSGAEPPETGSKNPPLALVLPLIAAAPDLRDQPIGMSPEPSHRRIRLHPAH